MHMTTLRAVGGSVMFAIPKAVLEGLDLQANAQVGLSVTNGKLVIDPHPKRRYALAELLAQCDASAPRTAEDAAWANDGAVGQEEI